MSRSNRKAFPESLAFRAADYHSSVSAALTLQEVARYAGGIAVFYNHDFYGHLYGVVIPPDRKGFIYPENVLEEFARSFGWRRCSELRFPSSSTYRPLESSAALSLQNRRVARARRKAQVKREWTPDPEVLQKLNQLFERRGYSQRAVIPEDDAMGRDQSNGR